VGDCSDPEETRSFTVPFTTTDDAIKVKFLKKKYNREHEI